MFILVICNAKMPYYCTVPRCTSMAGKVKNVSFHQFPRDEELAKLWNKILKRGKPYTKYSKVCSLHFTPDDYTITNAGKYKGQWRTLRKDAIPSRNLPSEPPVPYQRRRDYASLSPSTTSVDPRLHQQMAQAIYVQTMLAMQAAGVTEVGTGLFNNDHRLPSPNTEECSRSPSSHTTDQYNSLDHIDKLLNHRNDIQTDDDIDSNNCITKELQHTDNNDTQNNKLNVVSSSNNNFVNENKVVTYKCNECSKCFKDPDVFLLHRRIHSKSPLKSNKKENLNGNTSLEGNTQETLKANPILANLLKSGIPQGSLFGHSDLEVTKAFDTNVVSIESQIMTALAANMENYLRNLSTIMTSGLIDSRIDTESIEDEENLENNNPDNEDSKDNNIEENGPNFDDVDEKSNDCDNNKDLDDSQDSEGLVIDEDQC